LETGKFKRSLNAEVMQSQQKGSHYMKTMKLATLTLWVGLGVLQLQADQTNLVQNIGIRLLGVEQGGIVSTRNLVGTNVDLVRVNTHRVIGALGTATGNAFSPAANLVLVTPLDGGVPAVQVRDGATTTDVTGFFGLATTSGSVQSSLQNRRSGRTQQTTYNIQRFVLQDNGAQSLALHFDVNGFATENSTSHSNNLNIDASGSGDLNGNLLIIQGSINVFGNTLEVVPGGGNGGPNV
jgi:hypothetical protein